MGITTTMVTENNIYETPINRSEISKDLANLISSVDLCKKNYQILAGSTRSAQLKAMCKKYATERAEFVSSLYSNLTSFSGLSVNESGRFSGEIKTTWTNLMNSLKGITDFVILDAVITSELMAQESYDVYLLNHIPPIEHLHLLTHQKKGIKRALSELKSLQPDFSIA